MAFKKRFNTDMGELAREFAPPPMPKLTREQLEDFDRFLEPFREEHTLMKLDGSGTEVVRFVNFNEAAVEFGAMSKRMYLGKLLYSVRLKPVDYDSYGNPTAYESPSMLERFQDKYAQFTGMKERESYAESARTKQYEEMAAQVGNPDFGYTEVNLDA